MNLVAVVDNPGAGATPVLHWFEMHLAPLPKPGDYLRGRAEPAIQRFQFLNQYDVKVAPKPFRRMASVMPQQCEHAAGFAGAVNQSLAALFSLRLREVQLLWIEERP